MNNLNYQEIRPLVGLISINRPHVQNALNLETLNELFSLLIKLQEEIKIIIITGTGSKAFIAGADIKEMNKQSPNEFNAFLELGQKITQIIEQSDWVSIAAVNGFALGGGTEIALACDFIIASDNSKFGLPEVKLGIIPGFGGTVRLSRKIGITKSKEIIFSGDIIDGTSAFHLGLVNQITTVENLLPVTLEFVNKILKNSLNAVLAAKKSINFNVFYYSDKFFEYEKNLCIDCFNHENRSEGMNAFSEKRSPNFEVKTQNY